MSKELNELIKELGKIVDGNQSIVDELDKLKSLYEKLTIEATEEFEYPFEYNEGYWFVSSTGDICLNWWYQDSIDTARCEMGNAFSTKEAAKKELEKRILLTKFRQFRDKCNGDWKPEVFECKYFITYDSFKNVLESSWNDTWDNFHTFGDFKHERDCLRAIELFGDEIKRLWVEE